MKKDIQNIINTARIELAGLTPENIEEIYTRNYKSWTYFRSDVVIVDGEKIDPVKRFLILFDPANKDKKINVSGKDKNEFELTEDYYIDEKLSKYKTAFEAIKDSYKDSDIEIRRKIKLYIDFMEARKNPQDFIIDKVKEGDKLTLDKIALFFIYTGKHITEENKDKIAIHYGYKNGKKLSLKYSYYSSRANRKGKPKGCTAKILSNKIKLFESVIEMLPTDKQATAIEELKILKHIYNTEYL